MGRSVGSVFSAWSVLDAPMCTLLERADDGPPHIESLHPTPT